MRTSHYSRFVREQLAGDVLWPATVDGVVATGFIAAGPWDFIGHAEVPEEKIDGKVARHLDRDDMVATTMNSFCSLTVQCAQCHDHKRDPVSMEDYYSLQAVFAALDRADRPYDAGSLSRREEGFLSEQLLALQAALAETEKSIAALKTPELLAVEQEIAALESASALAPAESGSAQSDTDTIARSRAEGDVLKWVQIDLGGASPSTRSSWPGRKNMDLPISDSLTASRSRSADDAEFVAPQTDMRPHGGRLPPPG